MLKTFQQLSFSPGLETDLHAVVSQLLQICPCPLSTACLAAWCWLILLLSQGLCFSLWMLVASSFWSHSLLPSPERPFLTTSVWLRCPPLALPTPRPTSAFFPFITISPTINVLTVSHSIVEIDSLVVFTVCFFLQKVSPWRAAGIFTG